LDGFISTLCISFAIPFFFLSVSSRYSSLHENAFPQVRIRNKAQRNNIQELKKYREKNRKEIKRNENTITYPQRRIEEKGILLTARRCPCDIELTEVTNA